MKIAIIHPWLPQYRLEFFELLVSKSAQLGIQVDIFYGSPPPELRDRNDSTRSQVATELPTKYIKVAGQYLNYKSIQKLRPFRQYDLIILEQGVRNLETYLLLLSGHGRVALWGHGRTYTKQVPKVQEWVKERITRKATHFFAYTQGGADHVKAKGFDSKSITVLNNTVDTKRLSDAVKNASDEEVYAFRERWSIQGPTAMFIGGLDESKRLDFLFEACKLVAERIPNFSLVVAGAGSQSELIQSMSAQHSWLKYVGPLFGDDKAIAIKASSIFAMPGRVGLVAVDSLATGRPIVTTQWNYHAPEFEYLTHDRNAVVSEDSVNSFAKALSCLLHDSERLESLSAQSYADSKKYSIENMVNNFIEGMKIHRKPNETLEDCV